MLVAGVAETFGEVRLRVTGASMVPAIWPGDILTVRRTDAAQLRVGQVVLYCRKEGLIAHRVTQIAADHVITKGDTLLRHDPPVIVNDVLGRVVGVERNGRCIRPGQSFWQEVLSSILRQSDFCLRVVLRLGRHFRWPLVGATAATG